MQGATCLLGLGALAGVELKYLSHTSRARLVYFAFSSGLISFQASEAAFVA